jgi:hypothetical protein
VPAHSLVELLDGLTGPDAAASGTRAGAPRIAAFARGGPDGLIPCA